MKVTYCHRWMTLAIPVVGLYLDHADAHGGACRRAPGPPEPLREGTCELAGELFPDTNPGPGTLKEIPVPEPTNLGAYVRNRSAAIALGKALFWDMQVGSDGVQACASCHFRGGRRSRDRSTRRTRAAPTTPTRRSICAGRTQRLQVSDFPLTKFADPTDRHSQMLRSIDDVVSSQGVHLRQFQCVERGAIRDITVPVPDPVFSIEGINTRRSEPRNTPTVINAAFTLHNFWDRRARNIFNGVNPHGAGDEGARVLRATGLNHIDPSHRPHRQREPRLAGGRSAAQRPRDGLARPHLPGRGPAPRVGTAAAAAESPRATTACSGPTPTDHRGLDTTYAELVERAFEPRWWQSNLIVVRASNGSISFVPRPNRPLRANEYTLARVQLLVVLRPVGAAL